MNKKSQRRKVAKELKVTKLSLPVRYRMAKAMVNGDNMDDAFRRMGVEPVSASMHCTCCGPEGWIYHVDGRRVVTEYGRFSHSAKLVG